MSESLRGVLIGCGYISESQLRAWQKVDEVEIVAVCDLVREKAAQRAREFDIANVYTDYERMLAEQRPDFVDIATRPASHLELVRMATQKGIAVLCQKPIADSMDEARRIVEICEEAGVTLMVNENARHQPWFRQAKVLLEEGRLGSPFYARFVTRSRASLPTPSFGGQPYFSEMPRLIVYEMVVHYLDTARYLFGEADSLYARLRRLSPHIAGEDFAQLTVNFGELTCLFDGSWASVTGPGPGVTWGPFELEGTEGTLALDRGGLLTLYTDNGEESWQFPEDGIQRSFAATQRHFAHCLLSGEEPETSGRETLKTMQLVFGAYRSGRTGDAVEIVDFR